MDLSREKRTKVLLLGGLSDILGDFFVVMSRENYMLGVFKNPASDKIRLGTAQLPSKDRKLLVDFPVEADSNDALKRRGFIWHSRCLTPIHYRFSPPMSTLFLNLKSDCKLSNN